MFSRRACWAFACIISVLLPSSLAHALKFELQNPFRFYRFESDYAVQRMAFDLEVLQSASHDRKQVDPQSIETTLNSEAFWKKVITVDQRKQLNWPKSWAGSTPLQIVEGLRAGEKRDPIAELIPKIPGQQKLSAVEVIKRFGWATLLDTMGSPDVSAVCWNRAKRLHNNCEPYVVPGGWTVRIFDESEIAGSCNWELAGAAKFRSTDSMAAQASCSEIYVNLTATKNGNAVGGEAQLTRTDSSGVKATLSVSVTDKLVVGLGDSFTSGEGNPDRPVILSPTRSAEGAPLPRRPSDNRVWAASWIDRSCHRSAYSWQIRSALFQTLVDPSRSVTLLALGCSGAEVVEGLLFPWKGVETSAGSPFRSQLGALYDELCVADTIVQTGPIPGRELDSFLPRAGRTHPWARNEKSFADSVIGKLRCRARTRRFERSIDAVLLGIGGNDLGFAKWIAAAITDGVPQSAAKGFIPRLEKCNEDVSACNLTRARIARLQSRYRVLKRALTERVMADFHVPASNFIVISYPRAVEGANGKVCPNGNGGMTVSVVPPGNKGTFEIRNNKELETIESFRSKQLVPMLKSFATSDPAFKFVEDFVDMTARHGFCATTVSNEVEGRHYGASDLGKVEVDRNELTETLHMPRVGASIESPDGIVKTPDPWRPFGPADWRPYAPRARWFRTPNDVFMTIDNKPSAVQEWTGIGILDIGSRGSSGAFHPTAAEHAAVTKGVAKVLRDVLP